MTTTLATMITPDKVMTFEILPGTLDQFLATIAEGGPRLKCYEGSVTLVSPGKPHERSGRRLANLILAICLELRIQHTALVSTAWVLPKGARDTAYESDESYYIQSHGTAEEDQVPDLAIEIVVSHPEKKALLCGAVLGIPEMWVMDIPHHRLTFYHLARRGKNKGTYQGHSRSRAFPLLTSGEVLERLDDPTADDSEFHENCRAWAKQVLLPRRRADGAGA
jgi:Uma2 family endonuclease